MIKITDFTVNHIEQAAHIASNNYCMERKHVPALPEPNIPSLEPYAENGFGVAAFEGGEMVGFLCSVSPFDNCFGSTRATGVFSPLHANGAIGQNRAKVYAMMYQAAGEKWARAGASSHAVCLYSHDKEAHDQFFRYGFGMRCVDAIRGMDEITAPVCDGITFTKLRRDEYLQILPLDHMLDKHMASSPTFILRPSDDETSFMKKAEGCYYFAARDGDEIIAFIKAGRDGETFVCDTPSYIHVNGAFCLPKYRGRGIYQNLFNVLIRSLREEGYSLLGVDFESINPTAYGFWLKYFFAYTSSVVRRIDENCLT